MIGQIILLTPLLAEELTLQSCAGALSQSLRFTHMSKQRC